MSQARTREEGVSVSLGQCLQLVPNLVTARNRRLRSRSEDDRLIDWTKIESYDNKHLWQGCLQMDLNHRLYRVCPVV